MKRTEANKKVKKGEDRMLVGRYWNDPMCGPIRP
ncbi:MAG: hypothetical protein A4E67_02108 [Syntrophaceae bacterium PtaB.Bin038]|jgi:hypothetical protein|nr:MAG: hypothetical protein A4E67_02108 [Syntrophaceae bacterium PtaB.Bin038]